MPDLHPFFDAPLAAAQAACDAETVAWQRKLEDEAGRRASAEQRAAGLQSQLDVLKANPPVGWPVLLPGTKVKADTTYLLPNGPIQVLVDQPNVTLLGGQVWPGNVAPAIWVKAPGCTIRGVSFHNPDAPPAPARAGVKECVRVAAPDCEIIACSAGAVQTFITALTGTDGLYVGRCSGSEDLRGGFIYLGGAKWVFITDCEASESQTENLVRSSPDNGNLTEHVYIARNRFSNDANGDPEKACIEVRSGSHFVIEDNELHSLPGHSCVGVGRKAKAGDTQPGSVDVIVRRNVCYEGSISVDGVSADTLIEGNEARWSSWQVNGFITADGRMGLLKNLTVRGNRGVSPVAQKPLFQPLGVIAGLVDGGDNAWAPPATTVPGGLGNG
jgi:hypothetical protein